jgi:excisionase family DNA binding protein
MLEQFEPFVDATRASEFLSISREYLVELARKGKVPAYPLGAGRRKTWRFRLSELHRVFGDPRTE